jgi:alpha-galactosidase
LSITSLQSDDEHERTAEFARGYFGPGAVPPFSFRYDGASSAALLPGWDFREESLDSGGLAVREFVYTEPGTGLEVRCRCEFFADFPAVEWVVYCANLGSEDSLILEDLQGLDVTLTRSDTAEFILHRAEGSYGQGDMSEFAPIDQLMPPSSRVRMTPVMGYSAHIDAFPYFNVEAPGEGVVVGIGWSGQWAAELVRDESNAMTVRAGMQRTRLRLRPGERIRTPRILMLFWNGEDRMRGQNMLRRFLLLNRTPQQGGAPVTMPLACSGSGLYSVANEATEQNQVETARRFVDAGLGPEYFWLDAGWFNGYWPNGVGNFTARRDGFPNGVRPLSDAVKQMGMRFILWLEPERAYKGTQVDIEHPEFLLKISGTPNRLFNFGNPDARKWVTDQISAIIERDGIDMYREDYNINPLRFWREADEPDREGITEIRWVEGLYSFWDELAERHSGLLIDNCASGGRSLDLERVMRSVALWRTDYGFYPGAPGPQCHTHGLNFWLPCSATGSAAVNEYDFRSAMSSGLLIGWHLDEPGVDLDEARRLISEFKLARPYFYGDYYPLTPHNIRDDAWIAYQFHRDDLSSGIFLAFRRINNLEPMVCLKLQGLAADTRYEITYLNEDETITLTGAELAAGLEVTRDRSPISVLARYQQVS